MDLTSEYQQILLGKASSKIVTINIHQGLYEHTKLPFGVASAPAILQKVMDSIVQGIPLYICYLDDILVSGRTNEEHIRNLKTMLQRLQEHGVRTAKCSFLQNSGDYLGHLMTAEGVHTTSKKVKAIMEVPAPQNVFELSSFLWLLNYYVKFIASILHALFFPVMIRTTV